MEKYARQAISEGVKNGDDLHVSGDSEIYRVLNLHYNRNNHIEVWGPQVRTTNQPIHSLPQSLATVNFVAFSVYRIHLKMCFHLLFGSRQRNKHLEWLRH